MLRITPPNSLSFSTRPVAAGVDCGYFWSSHSVSWWLVASGRYLGLTSRLPYTVGMRGP